MNDKRLNHVPGPGKFETPAKDKTERPTWSIPRNDRFKKRDVLHPGPGYYEYSSFTQAGPKFTTREKPFIDPFKCRTKPGPGLYDP